MKWNLLQLEIQWSFARSSGPGGQNVNKVETKAEGRFFIAHSLYLTSEQKNLIRSWVMRNKPSMYLPDDDAIRISDQSTRSRERNKSEVLNRLKEILTRALTPQKKRIPTKPTKASKVRRKENKKRVGEKKKQRGKVKWD